MFATVCRAYGAIENLRYETLPSPTIAPGQVRVEVEAAGVSFANTVVVAGRHQNTPELPFVPGTEVVGTVREVSPGVSKLRPGDRVMASLRSGAFSTEFVADPFDLYPITPQMDPFQATSLPTLYGTAFGALRWRAQVRPGQTLLVLGAGGGTGLAAVDVGRMLGCRVIACVGSDEKGDAARSLGAEHVIDHRAEDLRDRVLELTQGRGADVVFDPVGGEQFTASMRCTAPEGTILVIGFASGTVPDVPANHLLVKNVTVSGFYWGFHLGIGRDNGDARVRANTRALLAEIVERVGAGDLNPRVYRVLPHRDAVSALRLVLGRQVVGKVALDMRSAGG